MTDALILAEMEARAATVTVNGFTVEQNPILKRWFIDVMVNGELIVGRVMSLREGLEIALNDNRAEAIKAVRNLEELSEDQPTSFPDPIYQPEEYARRFG